MLRAVISAQEDERRRVARELHDETSQLVAAMAMELHAGRRRAITGRDCATLARLVDRMHDGLHRIIVNLRPSVLDDLGLGPAIEWLAEHQLRRSGIAARSELGELQDCRADAAIEIALFRIVQESITNIVRHAQASAVLDPGGSDGRPRIGRGGSGSRSKTTASVSSRGMRRPTATRFGASACSACASASS